jgi:hypothetical protein
MKVGMRTPRDAYDGTARRRAAGSDLTQMPPPRTLDRDGANHSRDDYNGWIPAAKALTGRHWQ